MRTALVNGREMTPAEIEAWVQDNRGYFLSRKTITKRIKAGMYGNVLLSKPAPCKRRDHKTVYPQKLVRVSIPGWGVRT